MALRSPLTALLVLGAGASAHAGKLPVPVSYTKPVAGGKFVFVQLGDPAAEEGQAESARAQFRQLREKYPQSGLYPAEGGGPVWVLDADYAPYDNTFPLSDGVHLARLEGEWWVERDYPAPRTRLAPEAERAQLDALAVGFYANGKLTRGHPLRDLLTDPADVKHSPRFVLWAAGAVLNEPAGRFVVMTQDANRITFDPATGEVIARDRVGLNNPLLGRILAACGVLSLAILGAWAWFAFGRRRVAPPSPSHGPQQP